MSINIKRLHKYF